METKEEIWRDIAGYEGLYQVSNRGQVKSLARTKKGKGGSYRTVEERILKPNKLSNGYLIVCLSKNGKHKNHLVHRLVASAFIPNENNLPQINHKREGADGKTDNRVENLEYCTAAYNLTYGTRLERAAKALSKQVYQYSLDGELLMIWPSTREIERETGYRQANICGCCNGKHKTAYHYKWSYTPINS